MHHFTGVGSLGAVLTICPTCATPHEQDHGTEVKPVRPSRVLIVGQECLVINHASFSGVLHFGIMFKMRKEHADYITNTRGRIVNESIGWIPASMCEILD